MKIQATIQLTNRDINVISKPMRGSMALGKRKRLCTSSENSSDPKVFLMFCTVSNRAGTKFEVCQNIASVHDNFLHLGECTIQLIKPARTIFISDADPLQLKSMLNLLKVRKSQKLFFLASIPPKNQRKNSVSFVLNKGLKWVKLKNKDTLLNMLNHRDLF